MDEEAARAVKRRRSRELLRREEVVGVGLGTGADGAPVLVVHVRGDPPPDLPAELDGLPVRVERTGPIRAG